MDLFNNDGQKVWIVAGEASGDLYGAHLARALRARRPGLTLQGMGGRQMAAAGVDLLVDATELGVIGVVEVLRQLPTFHRLFRGLVSRAARERPGVVVLIDYPGFNLRLARELHTLGLRVVYYISPQVWAWRARRKALIARVVNRMLVIFPFERDLYRDYGLPTTFIGHPLVDILAPDPALVTRDPNLIVLLPGSRRGEIDRLFPPLFRTACALHAERPQYRFVVPLPRPAIASRVGELLRASRGPEDREVPIEIVVGQTTDWLRRGVAGLAKSGTVTVEAAILGLPLVVVYRMNPLSFLLAQLLVKVPYMTMPNLIVGGEVFQEYVQGAVCPKVLVPALKRILPGGERREAALAGMRACVERLGGGRRASETAADLVLAELDAAAAGAAVR